MSENEPEKPKKGWGCLQWGVVVGVCFFVGIIWPTFLAIQTRSHQVKASSNARQIIGLMMSYASDYEGHYPDHGKEPSKLTANAALRSLVQEELIHDETIFGSQESRFKPDGNLGQAPDYAQALEPGENHWMMVANQKNTSPTHYPILMENAADVSWPPKWLPPAWFLSRKYAEWTGPPPPRGRSWGNGTIIVGFNDASVQTVKLERKDGRMHLPDSVLKPAGKEPLPELKILDVE